MVSRRVAPLLGPASTSPAVIPVDSSPLGLVSVEGEYSLRDTISVIQKSVSKAHHHPIFAPCRQYKFNFKDGVNLPASGSRVPRLDEVACGINFVAGLRKAEQTVCDLAAMGAQEQMAC